MVPPVPAKTASVALPLGKVPEILAPAGGRAQFFAALQSGADAVYLGLKAFNARARAENFSIDDLRELLPLAHTFGMKVLVTFNVLIKDLELKFAIETLAELEDLGVHAIIVQDLAVARLVRKYFPGLRLHASTQMAVHNLWGVEQAKEFGFKRVVLAREMTAQELRQIRTSPAADGVELEAFCHGSLCYSYSGLCFFSGAEDARSGNRGECAYTCRQPYKIVSEPGHGFLFSMRDLDTSAYLDKFVSAGIDCLKIEGRKKDAQYVSTVVRVYRNKLNELMRTETLRPEARALVQANLSHDDWATIQADLAVTFQRRPTSFFLKSRYHENVIDLDNPSHLGLKLGSVEAVSASTITFRTSAPLARFDGLKIEPGDKLYHALPQDGAALEQKNLKNIKRRYENETLQFSLRSMSVARRNVATADADDVVTIELPEDVTGVRVGDVVFKTRSNDLKQRVEKISGVPAGQNLKPHKQIKIQLSIAEKNADVLQLNAVALRVSGKEFLQRSFELPKVLANKPSTLARDLIETFAVFGDVGFASDVTVRNREDSLSQWFVPKSALKSVKHTLRDLLTAAYDDARADDLTQIVADVHAPTCALQVGDREFAIKIDRLEYVASIAVAKTDGAPITEIVFEPKRSQLGVVDQKQWLRDLYAQTTAAQMHLRIAIPTVLRAWDAPLLKIWLTEAYALGVRRFEVGNVGALKLLREWNLLGADTNISSDFTLYTLNREATKFWHEQGVDTVCLSIEDDLENLSNQLANWATASQPSVILYKDTPLFIAEACSLTALHNGCPTAKVCGYRSLEIENPAGERFHVAHESCKSIVYGERAFAWSQHLEALSALGVKKFRVDFLTRSYTDAALRGIIAACVAGQSIVNTHDANFSRTLL